MMTPCVDSDKSNDELTALVSLVAGLQILTSLLVVALSVDRWIAAFDASIWVVVAFTFAALSWVGARQFGRNFQVRRAAQMEHFFALLRHDALTGTLNRNFFIDRVRSEGKPGSLLVIDVDHFKAINDRFGHYTGDAALAHLATCMIREVGQRGYVGRLGGEEFAVFFPGLLLTASCVAAEELRETIEASEFEFDGRLEALTVSIGVSEHGLDKPIGRTLRIADDNLYAAKKVGRNCIAAHSNASILLQERAERVQQLKFG